MFYLVPPYSPYLIEYTQQSSLNLTRNFWLRISWWVTLFLIVCWESVHSLAFSVKNVLIWSWHLVPAQERTCHDSRRKWKERSHNSSRLSIHPLDNLYHLTPNIFSHKVLNAGSAWSGNNRRPERSSNIAYIINYQREGILLSFQPKITL